MSHVQGHRGSASPLSPPDWTQTPIRQGMGIGWNVGGLNKGQDPQGPTGSRIHSVLHTIYGF